MSDELRGGTFTVVEGLDGHLFVDSYDGIDVMGLYTDPSALPAAAYDIWFDVLRRRREYFERRGTAYLTLVVPDPCLVYPDKLPAGIVPTPDTPFRQLEARLDDQTRAQCVYVLDDLVAGRTDHDTFQVTDSHWTDFGAYLAYRRTMTTLAAQLPGIEILPPERLEWSERVSFGALGVTMEEERSERLRTARVVDTGCRRVRAISTEVRDGFLVVEQDRPDLPTAVVFRDSFMNNAHKFFSESFRRTVYVSHPNRLYFDLVEAERPDVVIFETVERRLCITPDEPSLADFRAVFGDLLLDDPEAVRQQVYSRSLLLNSDPSGALAANDAVLARVEPTARLMVHRARVFNELGDSHAALEALRTAATLDSDDAPVHYHLAHALRRHGLVAEAARSARRAAEVESRHAAFWSLAATATLEAGDAAAACSLAEQGLRHHDDASLHNALGSALVAAGHPEAAVGPARRAVELEPGMVVYRRQLLSVLIRAGDWAAARSCLNGLRDLDPESTTLDAYAELIQNRLADDPTRRPAPGGSGQMSWGRSKQ